VEQIRYGDTTLYARRELVVLSAEDEAANLRKAKGILRRITRLGTKAEQDRELHPVRGVRTSHEVLSSLVMFGRFLCVNRLGHLGAVPAGACHLYLLVRAQYFSPSQLKKDRMSLEFAFGELPPVKAVRQQMLGPRAYTLDQINAMTRYQSKRNAFSTRLAFDSGLRGFELLTIARPADRPPSDRRWPRAMHMAKGDGVVYTVHGKGKLFRPVHVTRDLAEELETHRRLRPAIVRDRGATYTSYYDIAGGASWEGSLSRACRLAFGASAGAHGTRHGYAHRRREQLQAAGLTLREANAIVTPELGHFRTAMVPIYSRGLWSPMDSKRSEERKNT
jgi:hypothetical protein